MKKTFAVILLIPLLLFASAFGLQHVAKANAQREHVWLMETLLPGGKNFVKVEYTGDDQNIRSVHKSDAGYIIETAVQGYADEIVMLVGVDNAGNVIGVVVLEAHETPGLGNRILTDHVFLSQFLNKSGTFTVGTVNSDAFAGASSDSAATGEEISVDAISGATVSSKAVVKCINSAVAYVTGTDIDSSATTWGG